MAPSRSRQSTAARQNDYCRWTADGIKFIGRSGENQTLQQQRAGTMENVKM